MAAIGDGTQEADAGDGRCEMSLDDDDDDGWLGKLGIIFYLIHAFNSYICFICRSLTVS